MMRISPSALFVCGAVALTAVVGVAARSAAKSSDAGDLGLPQDASRLGFVPNGEAQNGVLLLDATQPFELGLAHGPIHGKPPRAEPAKATRAILARELARYPQGFLTKIRLKGIVLCDDLHEGDTAIPSLPNVATLLLLDISGSDADLTRGLHHEIFHFADLADDGALSPDPAWELLNEPGFAYGAGGRTLRSAWASRPPADDGFLNGGFVSSYATSGVEEDKAETFAFAMARPADFHASTAKDPILAQKRTELLTRIAKLDASAPSALGL